jgi:DNA polymerase III subunit epsilon
MYAVVDIETTGSYAAANGITEISIQVFDGMQVVETFETLINPLQHIPRFIESFTGISDAMVKDAPTFEQVAEKIHKMLQDKIFVAHNVNFDYSFIKINLETAGFEFNVKKLCTVRLSRKIFPGFQSYSLGRLCDTLGIRINGRHRAGGDAIATVTLFKMLLENDEKKFIEASLKKNSKEQILPPNVPKENYDLLPMVPGVYYFHNAKGKIIYVGKAKNIRSRVNSHFSNNSAGRQKQNFINHVFSISFKECATEMMASILESVEIKRLWPAFNASQKRWEDVYGIFSYEDQNGYLRLAIEKNKRNLKPVASFHYLVNGHAILRKITREFNLCPKFCFLQTDNDKCIGIVEEYCYSACEKEESPEEYNNRVSDAILSLQEKPSFMILDKGLNYDEQSCILILKGDVFGMGYLTREQFTENIEQLKDLLTPLKQNSFIQNLVIGYAARFPEKIIQLNTITV